MLKFMLRQLIFSREYRRRSSVGIRTFLVSARKKSIYICFFLGGFIDKKAKGAELELYCS